MSMETPTDRFDRPAMLGNCDGKAVPVKVSEDGSLSVNGVGGGMETARYNLENVLRLDLSVARTKEMIAVAFDSFAVTDLEGSFFMYIGNSDESKRCTIDKCLSVGVSAEAVYFTNTVQSGYAEIWFFKLKEASE